MSAHLWIRSETRLTERRVPIVPVDAGRLVEAGLRVTIEESPHRIIGPGEYRDLGCTSVPAGSWVDAPDDAYVLGIKELPDQPDALRHTHIMFAHAYKGQEGAAELLARFRRGGGTLLDLEYLTDETGSRVVAFGRWAGYVGATLGLQQLRGSLQAPLEPMERAELDSAVVGFDGTGVRALVVGARGRSGRGALQALRKVGVQVTTWDRAETASLDKAALLDHDLLVNCVVTQTPQQPLLTPEDLDVDRRLRTVVDVTCDVCAPTNMLPVNTAVTTWEQPVRRLEGVGGPLDVIAIDNLPSLIPRESSTTFSEELTEQLLGLEARTLPWRNAEAAFDRATAALPTA